MEFLVEVKGLEAAVVPPLAEIAAVKASLQQLKNDPRIKHMWAFADGRGGALIADVSSAEQLQELIGSLPASRLSEYTVHPLSTLDATLRLIEKLEENFAKMMPAGAAAGMGSR
jgi:muconolactone delta-isomerase